ncbi:MAG: DHH family phosphoesterase [Longimicrobiales bacterium]
MSDAATASTDVPVPAHRRAPLTALLSRLDAARRIVLTTHVNADGDGAGSQAALAAWLTDRGKRVHIVNPTPFPAMFRFLIRSAEQIADAGTPPAAAALSAAELLLVVDTAEPKRIGRVASALKRLPIGVLDHHPPSAESLRDAGLLDPTACATGELVYDLLRLHEQQQPAEPWSTAALEGIYTAIVTDTGSFRFSNTRPRTHLIAADLLRRGVDPERMYRLLYGSVPIDRVRLLAESLQHLHVEPTLRLAWIEIPAGTLERLSASTEDLDGIIEQARTIEGTEVAVLMRQTRDGSTKVSWRSNGRVDVNALARLFGGGGHLKAAGALIAEPLEQARERVLAATSAALQALVDDASPV